MSFVVSRISFGDHDFYNVGQFISLLKALGFHQIYTNIHWYFVLNRVWGKVQLGVNQISRELGVVF